MNRVGYSKTTYGLIYDFIKVVYSASVKQMCIARMLHGGTRVFSLNIWIRCLLDNSLWHLDGN